MAAAQIKAQLQRALANCTQTEQILFALARLDCAGTAAWLIAEERSARDSFPTEALSKLLDIILTVGLSEKDASLTGNLLALARLYSDVLSPDLAAALAWSLPPGQRNNQVRELVNKILRRAPHHWKLLRVASEMAVEVDDAKEAHTLLTQLAKADDSPATINYVYQTRAKLSPSEGPHVRAAFLSSFIIEPLVPYVDLELRKLGLVPEFYVAPFNSWALEIMDENSHFRRFDPEIAFLAVAIDDLIPELAGAPSVSLLQEKGGVVVDHLMTIIERFTAWSKGTLVVHSFHSPYRSPFGVLESRIGRTRFGWLNELNMHLAERLQALPRVFLLDMNELLIHRRGGYLDNPKMRYLARMRLGDRVLPEVACAYARYVAPLKGLRRKCVVLDLDNTLWGGVVGEDGPHGIKLGDTAPGVEYQDFQRCLLSLTERGFLLAVNSKNNPDDALAVIRSHEGMVLREDAFSAIRINWRPKTENMASIAEELNIGLDSMVFLDDNPDERELMRQVFPEVLTPELPPDPSLYRCTVELLPQLQSLVMTEEDKSRVQQYRSKRQRDQIRARAQSIEEYLLALEISVQISHASDGTLSRLHQLFERTNQFNLTTRRYTAPQLAVFVHDPGWRFYTLRAQDRFGDHGLVATALVRVESHSWTLDSFIMSCRVIGYGVETALLAAVSEGAKVARATTLVGEYIPSAKNSPAGDFYTRHGFTDEGAVNGVTRWRLALNKSSITRPRWIKMEIADAT